MALHAFVAPLLPGKTEEWRRWMGELNGARKQEFDDSRRRLGVRERTFLQTTPRGDFVVVTLEGDSPVDSLKRFAETNDSFSQWFAQRVRELHGVDLRDIVAAPAPELVIDTGALGTQRKVA